MASKNSLKYLILIAVTMICADSFAQNSVALGIHYQAVARDNYGNELANRKISVKFSIISGDPLASPVYQEVHQDVTTSRYGVFSLVIGNGIPTGSTPFGELSQIEWNKAFHYLKVEVKFENSYMDMGTMQFLAVPYALYAQKSLEPGPEGPKGDPGPKGEAGDPATDNQTLSVINVDGSDYLSISGGNGVKISSIERDGDPTNEIQDLIYDNSKRELRLLKSTAPAIDLSELKDDADADPTNEIQDLHLTGNQLTIDKNASSTGVDLSKYLDDKDNQGLTYSESTNTLSIDRGNSVTLGSMVAFRAEKNIPAGTGAEETMVFDNIKFNDGLAYNNLTGEFVAPFDGIYTFNIRYNADLGAKMSIYLNGQLYEIIAEAISSSGAVFRSITIKLAATNIVKVVVNKGMAAQSGTGSFSGYKVY